jgi:hypothetical protein
METGVFPVLGQADLFTVMEAAGEVRPPGALQLAGSYLLFERPTKTQQSAVCPPGFRCNVRRSAGKTYLARFEYVFTALYHVGQYLLGLSN